MTAQTPKWALDGIPLAAVARCQDPIAKKHWVLIGFIKKTGDEDELLVPKSKLRDRTALLAMLDDAGAEIPFDDDDAVKATVAKLRKAPERAITLIRRPGLHGTEFVLSDGANFRFHPDWPQTLRPGQTGTLAGWQTLQMIVKCSSRMIFATALSFGGPLLHVLGVEAGGVHFYGETSILKSTTALCAIAVWGHPETFGLTWNATAIGLEEASRYFDGMICSIDDIKKLKGNDTKRAETAHDVSYGVTGGDARIISGMAKGAKPVLAEKLATNILSTGEKSLQDIAQKVGQSRQGGEALRISDIAGDAGEGWGVMEKLSPGHKSLDDVAKSLRGGFRDNHGVAGAEFVKCLTRDLADDREALLAWMEERRQSFRRRAGLAKRSSAALDRQSRLFELAYIGGSYASRIGVWNLSRRRILAGVLACYQASTLPASDSGVVRLPASSLDDAVNKVIGKLNSAQNFQDLRLKGQKRDRKASAYYWRLRGHDVVLVRRKKLEKWIGPSLSVNIVVEEAIRRGLAIRTKRGTSVQPGKPFGNDSFIAFVLRAVKKAA